MVSFQVKQHAGHVLHTSTLQVFREHVVLRDILFNPELERRPLPQLYDRGWHRVVRLSSGLRGAKWHWQKIPINGMKS